MATPSPVLDVIMHADGYGRWRAEVVFTHPLYEITPDPTSTDNLKHQWPRIRRAARSAIVRELVTREQRTYETRAMAESRVRASLPPLSRIEQYCDKNTGGWHTVTFGEPFIID